VSVPHRSHYKKFLPHIQSESTLFQFKTITPCPITTNPTKKSVPTLLTSPLQALAGCSKVSLQPSLLQAEQPQLSQPSLTGEVFQPLDCSCGPCVGTQQTGAHVHPYPAAQRVPRPHPLLRCEPGPPRQRDSPRGQDNQVPGRLQMGQQGCGRDHVAPELEAMRTEPHPWLRNRLSHTLSYKQELQPRARLHLRQHQPCHRSILPPGQKRVLQLAQSLSISASSLRGRARLPPAFTAVSHSLGPTSYRARE